MVRVDEQARAAAVAAADGQSFERLVTRLRRARRWYLAMAVGLVAAGLGSAAAGLLGLADPAPVLVAVGLLTTTLATLPWRETLDRRDRADGLEALAEEWAGLPLGDEAGRTALSRLVGAVCGGHGAVGGR
jgi:hypothetical protein